MLFIDRKLRILRFSSRVGELFNIREADRGRRLTELTHRLAYPELAGDARVVLDTLEPREREVVDTVGRWYLARMSPHRAAHDRVVGLVITLIEITERKQAERALLERAEADEFRLALTDAIHPLVEPRAVQAAAARLLAEHFGIDRVVCVALGPGGSRGEIAARHGDVDPSGELDLGEHGPVVLEQLRAGQTVAVADVGTDARLDASARARAQERGAAAFVCLPVREAERLVGVFVLLEPEPRAWTAAEVALMREAVERTWAAAVERERVASSLHESEGRYRTLFESIDEGFCIIEVMFADPADEVASDYAFVEVNPAFADQTGLAHAAGRRVRELAPELEPIWFETYGRVARTGERVRFEAESYALGRFFDVNAFRIGEPEQRRVAVLFNDISERKRLERELSEANRRKDEFLATLAHELRNPLAPITNVLALLRRPRSPERLEELHAIIGRQVGHMVRLVDELLDLSRITRGIIELRKQLVDLAQIVRTAVETSGPHLEQGQRRLEVVELGDGLLVEGDPTRLVQIIANLLNNAAKFTHADGRIWLTLAREGGHARLSVRDDGVGIPPDKLTEVFEMFAQVEPAKAGGLGIGLTLIRSLVTLHGGSIEAHSEGHERGCEFVVRLPLAAAAREPIAEASHPAESTQVERACPTLVVDDNEDAADSLALLLAAHGLEVKVAYDGPRALSLCGDWLPALAFLDLGLPGMDGFALARALRELPGGAQIEVVALTGAGQASDRQRAHAAGFDQFIVKPMAPEVLADVLARVG